MWEQQMYAYIVINQGLVAASGGPARPTARNEAGYGNDAE